MIVEEFSSICKIDAALRISKAMKRNVVKGFTTQFLFVHSNAVVYNGARTCGMKITFPKSIYLSFWFLLLIHAILIETGIYTLPLL